MLIIMTAVIFAMHMNFDDSSINIVITTCVYIDKDLRRDELCRVVYIDYLHII